MTDISLPWTCLEQQPIFKAARHAMSVNRRRHYHNFDHVARIYAHAERTFGFSYDRALDLAILTHDVVFDSSGDREMRSIAWLAKALPLGEDDPDFPAAARMITETIDHRLSSDPRMVLLDMADFIDPEVADRNTELLRAEARDLHGVKGVCFAISCERYLGEMSARFRAGAENLSPRLRNLHADIAKGICRTRARLDHEARHYGEEPQIA